MCVCVVCVCVVCVCFQAVNQFLMAQVVVTGASGYIALHVCEQAAKAGHRVRGTVRSKSNAAKCDPLLAAVPGIELVEADLLSDEGWAAALKDCKYVFHGCANKLPPP